MAAEKNFEERVKKYLTDKGAYVIKYAGSAQTRSGVPDLLVCYKGRFIGIELKAPNGRVSELQKHHLLEIRKSGGIGYVLYPQDWEAFKSEFEDMVKR